MCAQLLRNVINFGDMCWLSSLLLYSVQSSSNLIPMQAPPYVGKGLVSTVCACAMICISQTVSSRYSLKTSVYVPVNY